MIPFIDLQAQRARIADKIDAAVRLLTKFDIVETVRTGKVVMARGLTET